MLGHTNARRRLGHEARRQAIPGVRLCIECQTERDRAPVARGGINRRGSKDSQLK